MCENKWGSATTLKFVEEYGKHRCLWDTEDIKYRNKNARANALQSISKAMNIDGFDIHEVKRKIRIIRSTYWNEKIKIQRRSEFCYKPKIKWYAVADSFLQTTKNWREFNANNTENENSDNTNECNKTHNAANDLREIINNETPPAITSNKKARIREKPLINRKNSLKPNKKQQIMKRKSRNLISTAVKVLIHDITKNKNKKYKNVDDGDDNHYNDDDDDDNEENEFDLFGKTVACQLKKLPIIDAIELQVEIQQLIVHRRLTTLQRQNNYHAS